MAVRFILGPAGSGKTEHCFERLRALERAGEPGIFLVPEQFTYTADRELLASKDLEGLRHIRVLSFTRLAFWLRETFHQPQPPVLPPEIRPLILRSLLHRAPVEQIAPLLPMRGRAGFLEELSGFIGEVRNHGALDFLDSVRRNSEVSEKVKALAEVYEQYAGFLRDQGRVDPEQILDGLEPLIARHSAQLAGWSFFVDGFLSWTRREREILVSLARTGAAMEVTFCLDAVRSGGEGGRGEAGPGARTPFLPVLRSLHLLRRSLEAEGITLLDSLRLEIPSAKRSSFERRLFLEDAAVEPGGGSGQAGSQAEPPATGGGQPGRSPADGKQTAGTGEAGGRKAGSDDIPVPEISVQPARDPRQEVILWARQIDRWIRTGPEPVAPEKVAVILRKVEPYRDLVREIFPRYGIPYFLDERRSTLIHPRIRLLLEAMEICLGGWRREHVISYLRNPLLGIPASTVDLLENLSLEYGRDFEAWLDTEWEEYLLPPRERASRRKESEEDPSEEILDSLAEVPEEDLRDDLEDDRQDLNDAPEDEITDGRMAFVEPVRRAALAPVHELEQRWAAALDGLTGEKAVESVREMMARLQGIGPAPAMPDPEPDWTERVQAALDRILDEMEFLWSGLPVSLDEFARPLRLALASLRIGVTPLRLGQVVVGDVQRSRLHGIERAVVGGLNEGEFPRTVAEDTVLAEQDRRELERLGIPLGPTADERQEEESYLFYIGLTRARQRMLLTWRQSNADGKAAEPALLLEEIWRALPVLPEIPDPPVPGKEAHAEWQTAEELGRSAAAAAAALGPDEPLDPVFEILYRELARARIGGEKTGGARDAARTVESGDAGIPAITSSRISSTAPPSCDSQEPSGVRAAEGIEGVLDLAVDVLERSRPALLYNPQTFLPEDVIEPLFPGEELDSSVSRLQGFARCPFQSYARTLLRLEPRPQARITPIESGLLAHDVLERFFQGGPDLDPRAVDRRLNRIFEDLKGLPQYRAYEVDEASRYRWQSTRHSLRRFLELETARLAGSPFRPAGTETAFGRRNGNPVMIPLPGGRRLYLSGRIDRLDRAEEGDIRRGLVIDYKRSPQPGLPKTLEDGLDLQLAVYLLFLRDVLQWQPVGGLYLPVLPAPVAEEKLKPGERNSLGLRAHGIVLGEEWANVDGGSGLLVKKTAATKQALDGDEELESLLDKAARYLTTYAHNQSRGWIAARPLENPPGRLPCDHCDYAAVCRFRPGRDPVRRKPVQGMEEV